MSVCECVCDCRSAVLLLLLRMPKISTEVGHRISREIRNVELGAFWVDSCGSPLNYIGDWLIFGLFCNLLR